MAKPTKLDRPQAPRGRRPLGRADDAVIVLDDQRPTLAEWERAIAVVGNSLLDARLEPRAQAENAVRTLAPALATGCFVFLLSDDGETLVPVALSYHGPGDERRVRRLFVDHPVVAREGVQGDVLRSSHTVAFSGTPDELASLFPAEYAQEVRTLGMTAILISPLRADHTPIGTIALLRTAAQPPFSKDEGRFGEKVADRLGVALANARLLREARATRDHLERLQRVTDALVDSPDLAELLRRARDALEATGVRLVTPDAGTTDAAGGTAVGWPGELDLHLGTGDPGGHGFASRVAAARAPLVVDAPFDTTTEQDPLLRAGLASMAGVPLLADDDLVGVLVVVRREGHFERDEILLLELAAQRIAPWIAREARHERLARLQQRDAFLSRLSLELSTADQDVATLLDVATRNLTDMLGDGCRIDLLSTDGAWLDPASIHHRDAGAAALIADLSTRDRQRSDEGLTGSALCTGKTLAVFEADPDEIRHLAKTSWLLFHERYPIRSLVAAPIRFRGDALGVILVVRSHPTPYADDDVALVEEVAARLAAPVANLRMSALQRATLVELERSRRRTEQLQAVSDTLVGTPQLDDLLGALLRAVDADATRLMVLTDDGTVLRERAGVGWPAEVDAAVELPLGTGFAGAIAARRQTMILDAPFPGSVAPEPLVAAGFHSLAGVPLLTEDELVGVVVVGRTHGQRFEPDDLALLDRAGHRVALALAHERARERLARAQERDRFLARLSYELGTVTKDLRTVLQMVAERLVATLGEICKIDIVSADGERFDLMGLSDRDPDAEQMLRDLVRRWPQRADEGWSGVVTRRGETVRVQAVGDAERVSTGKPEYREWYERFPIRSGAAVPLRFRGALLGVVLLGRRTPEPIGDDDVALLEDVAARVSPAIADLHLAAERERTMAELEANQRRLERLESVTQSLLGPLRLDELLHRLQEVLAVDVVRILEVTTDGTALAGGASIGLEHESAEHVSVPIGRGFAGAIARTREPIVVDDLRECDFEARSEAIVDAGVRAIAGVPLVDEDDLLGVLWVARLESGPFPPEDVDLLQQAAHRIALVLAHEHANVKLRVAHERDEFLAALGDVILTVGSDPGLLLDYAATQLATLLGGTCIVELLSDDSETLGHGAAFDTDPEVGALAASVVATDRVPSGLVVQVIRTATSMHVDLVDDVDLDRVSGTTWYPLDERFPPRSIYLVPIRDERRVTGVLRVSRDERGRYLDAERELVDEVAVRIGLALSNARLSREQREAHHELAVSESRYRRLAEHAPDMIYRIRRVPTPTFEYVSPASASILGYTPEEFYERPDLLLAISAGESRAAMKAAHESATSTPVNARLRRKDGREIRVEVRIAQVRDDAGAVAAVEGILRDVTELRATQDAMAYRAMHDDLTDLPNRHLFMDRLRHALAARVRGRGSIAVLFLDVDRFKVVNDSLGHAAGDRLLMGLAKRLEACIRPSDTIARMGGDEFAILVEGLVGASTPVRIAQRIQQFLERPLVIDGRSLYANVSIGIAVAASGPESPDISPADLLRHADAALYRAKERGRNRFEIFDEELRASLTERLTTEVELHHALEAGELAVHYQPLLELASYAITNVEALVRWWHPRRGLLAAAEFIDVAEDSGLVVPIGLFVLETACRQQRAWARSLGDAAPAVSVNLSDRQLSQPSLVDDLRAVLERTGTDPERIWLEITESSLIDIEHSARVLRDVRDLGFHLSIDDFGTCYSSLSYLRRYPIEALKIDRSFVQGLAKDPDSDAIVTAIVTLAHALDLAVTAEGVEEHVQLDALTGIGASTVQGYLVGRPAPADEITSMLGRPVVVGSGAGSGGGSS